MAQKHTAVSLTDIMTVIAEAVTNRIGSESLLLRLKSSQKLTQKVRMPAQTCTQADWATSASAHVTVLQYKSRLIHSRLCSPHTIVRKQKHC